MKCNTFNLMPSIHSIIHILLFFSSRIDIMHAHVCCVSVFVFVCIIYRFSILALSLAPLIPFHYHIFSRSYFCLFVCFSVCQRLHRFSAFLFNIFVLLATYYIHTLYSIVLNERAGKYCILSSFPYVLQLIIFIYAADKVLINSMHIAHSRPKWNTLNKF